jgi:flagellar basal body-associated protein FliL
MSDDEVLPTPPRWRGLVVPVVALLAGAAMGAGGFLAYSTTAGAESAGPEGEAAAGDHGEAAAGDHGEAAAGDHGEAAAGDHGEAAAGEHGGGGGGGEGGHGGGAADAPPPSTVENLGMFTVNLKGSGGGRVLRMEVQVESPKGIPQVKANHALLRDAVITLVSDYSWSDVEGLEGKTRLRDELLQRMNALLPSPLIERVYFTDFIVQ